MNVENTKGGVDGMLSRIARGTSKLSSLTAKAWQLAENVILRPANSHAFAVGADAFFISHAIRESMPPTAVDLEALS